MVVGIQLVYSIGVVVAGLCASTSFNVLSKVMLGVHMQLADLTGELMRLAIGRISDGEIDFAQKICKFVRDIYRELTLVVPSMDDSHDMKTKMDTMLQSVMKIENGMCLHFLSFTML